MERPRIKWTFDALEAEQSPLKQGEFRNKLEICCPSEDIIVIAGDQTFSVLDANTGTCNWQVTTDQTMDLEGVVENVLVLSDATYPTELLVGYDIESGTQIWGREMEFSGIELGESHIFLESGDTIIALDAATGRQAWSYQIKNISNIQSPDSLTGLVTCVKSGNDVYLNSTSGEPVWERDILALWSYNNQNVFDIHKRTSIQFSGWTAEAVDLTTGKTEWQFEPPKVRPGVRTMAVNEQWTLLTTHHLTIILEDDDPDFHDNDMVYLVSTTSGECQWSVEFDVFGTPLEVAGGILTNNVAILYGIRARFGGGSLENIHSYDIHTGNLLWRSNLPCNEMHDLGNGNLGICSSGTLHMLSATTGDTQWTFTASDSRCSLTATSELLILADQESDEGTVYALENDIEPQNETDTKVYDSSTKFCSGCGTDLAEYSSPEFCPSCGTKI